MGRTRVVNIRKEAYDAYIGRAGHGMDGYFGNPFRLEPGMARGDTLDRYRKYFYHRLGTDEEFRKRIEELQGKTLGCFCKPNPCHGDIIKEYLDRMAEMRKNSHRANPLERMRLSRQENRYRETGIQGIRGEPAG